jgi:hypothetical protein
MKLLEISLAPQQVLVWTCVVVFMVTCIITILGIIGKINIAATYLNRLFVALILQIVTIGVLAVKDSFKPTPVQEFIKIVSPSNDFIVGQNRLVSIYGAYNKSAEEIVKGELKIDRQIIPLINTSSSDNIFYTNIDSSLLKRSEVPKIYFSIYKSAQRIVCDSIYLKK